MSDPALSSRADAAARLPGRLERLPLSRFHRRVLAVVGLAHLFDSFDSLTIAFVLPSLIALWGLSPLQIGLLLATGYVGQLIGAVAVSGFAERVGRRAALRFALSVIAIMALACAAVPSFGMLLLFRFLQGIGLGGEVPVAASYLNELCPARLRGRVVYILQSLFAAGTLVTAGLATWLIPAFGWRIMFVIGGLPLILALLLNRLVPESPRWLAARGRTEEAERVVAAIEQEAIDAGAVLPPVEDAPAPVVRPRTHFSALFRRGYATRTLSTWAIAFCLSLTGYGLLTWMPTVYASVYRLPLEQALRYGLLTNSAGMFGALAGAWLVERAGRRACFLLGFIGGAIPLLLLAATLPAPLTVALLATVAMFFLTLLLSGIYVYAPEIYPTEVRALGTGLATAWMRIASIVGPLIVATLIARAGIGSVFALFGGTALFGAAIVALFVIETRGRRLEDIAG